MPRFFFYALFLFSCTEKEHPPKHHTNPPVSRSLSLKEQDPFEEKKKKKKDLQSSLTLFPNEDEEPSVWKRKTYIPRNTTDKNK